MNKHYIRIDNNNNIIYGFSDAFQNPELNDICINENGERHFTIQDIINPSLIENGIYLYKYINNEIVKKTNSEINIEKYPEVKQNIINSILNYRWSKQNYFTYDNHIQRWEAYDAIRIKDSKEALQNNLMPSITWKYENGDYVTITDYLYFHNMYLSGYQNEQILRNVEKLVLDDLDNCDPEDYNTIDWINKFEDYLAEV